jgi:hypothetical protein
MSDGVDAEAPISVVGLSPRPPSPRTLMALDDPRRVRPRAHFALGLRALPSAIARPPPPPPPAVWSGDETDREGDDGGRPSLACPSGERRPAPTADGRRVDDCAVGSQTSGEPVAEGRRLAAERTDEAHDDGGGSVGTCWVGSNRREVVELDATGRPALEGDGGRLAPDKLGKPRSAGGEGSRELRDGPPPVFTGPSEEDEGVPLVRDENGMAPESGRRGSSGRGGRPRKGGAKGGGPCACRLARLRTRLEAFGCRKWASRLKEVSRMKRSLSAAEESVAEEGESTVEIRLAVEWAEDRSTGGNEARKGAAQADESVSLSPAACDRLVSNDKSAPDVGSWKQGSHYRTRFRDGRLGLESRFRRRGL